MQHSHSKDHRPHTASIILSPSVSRSPLSLSQRLKQASELQASMRKSTRLPPVSVAPNAAQEVYAMYQAPSKAIAVASRLSGLSESVNSSALFTEKVPVPTRPVTVCLRCSATHAALCMPCAEQDCQNALLFYRKTRAAGAATLFSKAFVEAGYTKLLKFFVFRLLKNSFEARKRQHLKKKVVVEKLFGANVVFIPFSAWKRYTKENITARKNKTIAELNERVKVLEAQVHKLSSTAKENSFQIESLKTEVTKRDHVIADQKEEIDSLKQSLRAERSRVRTLAKLVVPLENFVQTSERVLRDKLNETGRYILHATMPSTYNYSYCVGEDVFDNLAVANTDPRSGKSAPPQASLIAAEIALRWINAVSQQLDDQLPPPGAEKLSFYLPPHSETANLFELRGGAVLVRAIVSIVLDRQAISRKQGMGLSLYSFTAMYSKSWPQKAIEIHDLENLRGMQNKPLDMISFALQLASAALELQSFSGVEVFQGKVDVIFHLITALMNSAVPRMSSRDLRAIDEKITQFYALSNDIDTTIALKKPDFGKFSALTGFLRQEFSDIAAMESLEDSENERVIESPAKSLLPNENNSSFISPDRFDNMSDLQYDEMCALVDSTTKSSQCNDMAIYCKNVASINAKLFELQSLIARNREENDKAIRLTSEVRQFIFGQRLNNKFVGQGLAINRFQHK